MTNRYLSYKPSGVDFLGDIPEHWKLLKLGRMGSFFKGGGGTKQDETAGGVSCVRYGDLYTHHQFFIKHTRSGIAESSTHNYRPLRYGDVLFAGSGETTEEIGKSAVNLIEGRAFVGGDVIVLRPSVEVDPRFLGYATDCHSAVYQKACMGRGVTVMHIYSNALKDLLIPVPPIDEQRVIADYLDVATARIDTLISKKRRLIELLTEKRTALITQTVTHGLAPSPHFRPSGIDWLRDIPTHWEVLRLKYRASYRTSNVDKKTKEGELPVKLCNYTDVYYTDRIRAGDGSFMEATASPQEFARFKLSEGDVVITKDSEDWQDIAVPALIEETADDFVCGYHLGIIRPTPLADPGFVFRAMQSVAVNCQLQVAATGITRFGLPNPAVGEALVPFPPLDEQRAIADYLDAETARIDALSSREESVIKLLQEYRTALITAAVTGQVAVET